MKKYLTAVFIILLSACQLGTKEFIPTQTPTQAITVPTPIFVSSPSPTPEIIKTLDELGYQIRVGNTLCDLKPIDFENQIVYLSECEDASLPINSEVIIELIATNEEVFQLINFENFEEIAKAIHPDALFGVFSPAYEPNKAGCLIPYKDIAGESIICGITVNNKTLIENEEFSILVKGKTIRIYIDSDSKSPNVNSSDPSTGWDDDDGPGN
jgi:hypothetical protein